MWGSVMEVPLLAAGHPASMMQPVWMIQLLPMATPATVKRGTGKKEWERERERELDDE